MGTTGPAPPTPWLCVDGSHNKADAASRAKFVPSAGGLFPPYRRDAISQAPSAWIGRRYDRKQPRRKETNSEDETLIWKKDKVQDTKWPKSRGPWSRARWGTSSRHEIPAPTHSYHRHSLNFVGSYTWFHLLRRYFLTLILRFYFPFYWISMMHLQLVPWLTQRYHPDCKVWHSRRDLVGAGPFWLVRSWCGLWHTGAVRIDAVWCGFHAV